MEAHKVVYRQPCSLVEEEEEDKEDRLLDCLAYLVLELVPVGCL